MLIKFANADVHISQLKLGSVIGVANSNGNIVYGHLKKMSASKYYDNKRDYVDVKVSVGEELYFESTYDCIWALMLSQ